MKRAVLFLNTLLAGLLAHAQNGWTPVTDPGNPITTFPSPGFYKGAAWVDYDVDGDIDLFAAPDLLFRNDGAGVFVQAITVIGNTAQQYVSGTSWADLDNDGDIDCIQAQWPSAVYFNNGNGTFTDESTALDSLTDYAGWACAIGDLDGDPFLDLVYTHAAGFLAPASPHPCRLFQRSTAAAAATLRTGYDFTDVLGPYTVPYWSDFDLDGDMDLFIASGPGGSAGYDPCYRNMSVELGQDTLVRMTTEQFAADQQDGQCYNFIDYDNDQDLDLCLTNYQGAPTRLYNNAAGAYTEVNTPFTTQTRNLANDWGDFDNDGDLDVIITADAVTAKYYRNDGNGAFVLLSPGISTGNGASGVTNGDYDNDGDLDVFVHGNTTARKLFRNDTVATGNHWISIKLQGVASNRSAIGAIVKCQALINGADVWQLREVNAQNSFQSQNDLRVHFGLGDAPSIMSLEVIWPSGLEQLFGAASGDRFYTLVEGGALLTSVSEPGEHTSPLRLHPNPATTELVVQWGVDAEGHDWGILDGTGRTLMQGRMSGGSAHIALNTLHTGAYRFVLHTAEGPVESGFIVR